LLKNPFDLRIGWQVKITTSNNRLCKPQALLAEARAICMQTKDYERAYEARKEKLAFQGN